MILKSEPGFRQGSEIEAPASLPVFVEYKSSESTVAAVCPPYTGTPLSVLSGMGGEQVLLSGKGVFSVNPDNAPFRTLELVLLPGNDAFL